MIGAIIAATAAGLAVYHYYDYSYQQPLVTIYPAAEKTKIRPKEAGGLVLANSDNSIYDCLQPLTNYPKVTILPEPEAPLNTARCPAENLDAIELIVAGLINQDAGLSTNNCRPATSPASMLPNILENAGSPSSNQPSNEDLPAAAALNIVTINQRTNKLAQPPATAKRQISADYKIQLASVKSEASAIAEADRIKAKYPKILSRCQLTFRKVQDRRGTFFYLVLISDGKTLSQAKAICHKLARQQQSCIVTNY